mgnify:CR=1 FL=1
MNLIIQLDEIKESGLQLEGDAGQEELPQVDELVNAGSLMLPEPVHYRFDITRLSGMVEIDGELECDIEVPCGRCLESYRLPISSRFSLTLSESIPECFDEEGNEIELSTEEMGLALIEGEEIDLLEPLQEQVLMALPIQPLCREECKGLCPYCGNNLNESECDCTAPKFDTRFASLKDFKVKNK